MVQTVYYYLDSNSESRHYNYATKHHTEKLVSQKNIASNICAESTKLKSKKNNCIRLQPLNAKVDNNGVLNTAERKLSHRLNPLPNKPPAIIGQRKLCSKIPVLQRKTVINSKQRNDNLQCDTALSAADRRQKFHQSRLHAAGVCPIDLSMVKKQHPIQYDLLPHYEGYIVHKIIAPPVPAVNLKSILPPIKPIDVTTGIVQKASQQKSKCLLGEITHFPALCNPLCSKQRKNHTSTVPHLPPILPPPAAPPPSISTSLEKDGNQIKEQTINAKKNEAWHLSKSTFHKLTVA